jgi:cytochrome P450
VSRELIWDEGRQAWRVCSQALAGTVFADPHVGVVQKPELAVGDVRPADEVPTVAEFFGSWFSRSPRHHQVRGELRRPYSAGLVATLSAMFAEVAAEMVDGLGESGDLMSEYFTPYGMRTTARMLDVPAADWDNLNKVIAVITMFLKKPLGPTFVAGTAEVRAMQTCIRYLRVLVERLFDQPGPSPLVAALKQIASTGDAGIWLAVTTVGQLLAAGVEPMTTGAGIACQALYADRGLRAAASAGTLDVGRVAEEAMRLSPPFPYIHRWVHRPCDCLGVHLEPGTYLVVDLRAVNRDPAVLNAPDQFRLQRRKSENQTFGRGPHTCLGIHSGRLQIAVALRTLVDRAPALELQLDKVDVVDRGYVLNVDALPFATRYPGDRP